MVRETRVGVGWAGAVNVCTREEQREATHRAGAGTSGEMVG